VGDHGPALVDQEQLRALGAVGLEDLADVLDVDVQYSAPTIWS
jgi:hypothetical protein